jgi:hypothetical protein
MKKFTFVTAFLLTITATSIFAQDGIVITLEGSATDISGGTHEMIAPDTAVFDVPFQIKNQTGNAKQWLISRYKVNVPTGWKDGLCWGHSTDPFGGTCYSSTQMAANPWTSSASQSALFTIADGEYGKMKPQIDPYNFTSAQAHYRYYVKEVGSNVYQDSVDLIIDFTASVNQIKDPVSVSIVPNPASDYIQISMTGIESAALKMVDVFGSTVLKENIGATKKLNVSDFNSGIYFLVFDVPGRKPFTRKVIIRN